MKKKILAALLIGALSLTGCGTDNTPSKTAQKDELTITVGRNMVAGKFDPTIGYGVWHPDIFHSHILTVGKDKEKPTGIAGGSSYAAQGPILPAARLRACGLFTCILLLATRKRVFKIQC